MFQFKIEHLEEVASTNTLLMERARQGRPEGLVIVAEHQTQGRGKPGRRWISAKGKNLLFSVLLRPPMKPAEAPIFTQIVCRAVAKVLKEKYDVPSVFRRPNDVMVAGKKICGILIEASSSANHLEAVVIGVGLNVNSEMSELPPEATSMMLCKGKPFELKEVLNWVLYEIGVQVKAIYSKNLE